MAEPLRIQQIRQFVITANSGSFRAAATGTFRSQAAVSAAMHDLERQIGAKLFEKGRRARLTPLAQTLLPSFSELLSRTIACCAKPASSRRPSADRSRSRSCRSWRKNGCRPFWPTFTRKFPDVKIRATDQRSPQVRAMVAEGLVDVGVAGSLAEDPKITFQPIATDTFGVLCPRDHPFAKRRKPDSMERAGRRDRHRQRLDGAARRAVGSAEASTSPSLVVTSRASLMACVKDGLGVTVVPLLTKAEKAMGLPFIPLVIAANIPHDGRHYAARPDLASDGPAHVRNAGRVAARLRAKAQGATLVKQS